MLWLRLHVFEFLTRRISCKAINILRSIGHLYANNSSTASENHISVLIISDLWIRGRWQLSNIRLMQVFTGFSDWKMNRQYCVCVSDIYMNCKRYEMFHTERGLFVLSFLEAKFKKISFGFNLFFKYFFSCLISNVFFFFFLISSVFLHQFPIVLLFSRLFSCHSSSLWLFIPFCPDSVVLYWQAWMLWRLNTGNLIVMLKRKWLFYNMTRSEHVILWTLFCWMTNEFFCYYYWYWLVRFCILLHKSTTFVLVVIHFKIIMTVKV